jgi:hypothetical protein
MVCRQRVDPFTPRGCTSLVPARTPSMALTPLVWFRPGTNLTDTTRLAVAPKSATLVPAPWSTNSKRRARASASSSFFHRSTTYPTPVRRTRIPANEGPVPH